MYVCISHLLRKWVPPTNAVSSECHTPAHVDTKYIFRGANITSLLSVLLPPLPLPPIFPNSAHAWRRGGAFIAVPFSSSLPCGPRVLLLCAALPRRLPAQPATGQAADDRRGESAVQPQPVRKRKSVPQVCVCMYHEIRVYLRTLRVYFFFVCVCRRCGLSFLLQFLRWLCVLWCI